MSENYKDALELVKAQASVRPMSVDEIATMIQDLMKKLDAIVGGEAPEVAQPEAGEGPAMDPKKSIKEKSVTCLCCGKNFKVLTKKHLAEHGLDKKAYLEKFGLKKGTTLIAKGLSRARKEKMKSMELWKRRGTKAAAEAKPKAAAPKKVTAKKAAPAEKKD